MRNLDLNAISSPSDVAIILRRAADEYRESAAELSVTWQDTGAGRPWVKIARILDRAADQCERVDA